MKRSVKKKPIDQTRSTRSAAQESTQASTQASTDSPSLPAHLNSEKLANEFVDVYSSIWGLA